VVFHIARIRRKTGIRSCGFRSREDPSLLRKTGIRSRGSRPREDP